VTEYDNKFYIAPKSRRTHKFCSKYVVYWVYSYP